MFATSTSPRLVENAEPIREHRGLLHDVLLVHLVPDRQDDLRSDGDFPCCQALKLAPGPWLRKECATEHDDAETALRERVIDHAAETVADRKLNLGEPHLPATFGQLRCERYGHCLGVLACVADEQVVLLTRRRALSWADLAALASVERCVRATGGGHAPVGQYLKPVAVPHRRFGRAEVSGVVGDQTLGVQLLHEFCEPVNRALIQKVLCDGDAEDPVASDQLVTSNRVALETIKKVQHFGS